jgi:hypothetical protein
MKACTDLYISILLNPTQQHIPQEMPESQKIWNLQSLEQLSDRAPNKKICWLVQNPAFAYIHNGEERPHHGATRAP